MSTKGKDLLNWSTVRGTTTNQQQMLSMRRVCHGESVPQSFAIFTRAGFRGTTTTITSAGVVGLRSVDWGER